jgi:hypothetical protein
MGQVKDYLGDSVYVEYDTESKELILTTNNGYPDDPRNVIYMERYVLEAFDRFRERVKLPF